MQLAAWMQGLIAAFETGMPMGGDWLMAGWRALSLEAASVALTALWQGAAIAMGLALCLRMVPRTAAANRFQVWSAAFLTLVSLPLLALGSSLLSLGSGATGARLAATEPATVPWLQLDARWSLAIAALWLVATGLRGGDLAIHMVRLRGLWKSAVPVVLDDRTRALLGSVGTSWRRRPVELCTTTRLQRPSVIGFVRPRILIPDWLLKSLTAGELEQIVLHETEHLRRGDDWTNLLQKLCLVLFPLNPALAWMERRLCREREMACDEGVVRSTHAPRAYAACLASLAERGLERRTEALSLGVWQRRPELADRVHSILRCKHRLSPLGARALLGVLSGCLLFGAVELARCPQMIAFVPTRSLPLAGEVRGVPAGVARGAYTPVRFSGADAKAYDLMANEDSFSRASALRGSTGTAHAVETRAASESADGRLNSGRAFGSPAAKLTSARTTATRMDPVRLTAAGMDPARMDTAGMDSPAPRAIMLKAEGNNGRPALVQEQQWIVVSAWEQVEPANKNDSLTADYDASAGDMSARPTAETKGEPAAQAVTRITVTRLILRVFPASSVYTQPGAAPMRDGWLVIQL